MGRSPCCEKVGLKKGPWTPEEDQKLLAYIEKHGHGSWRALPAKAGLQRCGKSCRLRWTNYLRPDIKRGKFSLQEEQTIIQLHALLGNRWSAIATHLPKRTDNEIKNYWNTHLKKRLAKMGIDPVTHKPKSDNLCSADGRTHNNANLSHMAQWESARLEAEARLAGEAKQLIQPYGSGLMNLGSSHLHQQVTKSAPTGPVTTTRPLCLDVLKAWQGFQARSTKCGAVFGHDLESPTSTLTFSENSSVPVTAFGFSTDNINNPAAATMELIGNSSTTSTDHQGGMINQEDQCDDQDQEELKSCLIGYKDISMDYTANHDNDVVTVFGIEEGHHDHPWSSLDSVKTEDDDDGHVVVPMTNFIDGFTDLLLGNSNNDHHHHHHHRMSNNSNNLTQSSGGNSDDNSTDVGTGCDEYDQENKNYWNSILNLVNSSPSDSTVF